MKKSIESTLLSEKNFDRYDFSLKDKFIKKTNDYYNNIIKGYYNIDYVSLFDNKYSLTFFFEYSFKRGNISNKS